MPEAGSGSMDSKDGGPSRQERGAPPVLHGYVADTAEVRVARDQIRLLTTQVETCRSCQLRCVYCRPPSPTESPAELSYERLRDLAGEARSLGARSIILTGGEPTLFPRFGDLVDLIRGLGMVPVVHTHCLDMTPKLARFLYQRGASVSVKLDSLREETQDLLCGVSGAAKRMLAGIECLLGTGFGQPNDSRLPRVGASFVVCKPNLEEIEELWRYCRCNGILPNMEAPTTKGRRKRLPEDLVPSREEVLNLKARLLELDRREYGYDWSLHSPAAAAGGRQQISILHVTASGDVRPCEEVAFDEHPEFMREGAYPHNINRKSLREVFTDPLFEHARGIESRLEEDCRDCNHRLECVGCRGDAYQEGVVAGQSPGEASSRPCPHCRRELEPN